MQRMDVVAKSYIEKMTNFRESVRSRREPDRRCEPSFANALRLMQVLEGEVYFDSSTKGTLTPTTASRVFMFLYSCKTKDCWFYDNSLDRNSHPFSDTDVPMPMEIETSAKVEDDVQARSCESASKIHSLEVSVSSTDASLPDASSFSCEIDLNTLAMENMDEAMESLHDFSSNTSCA